MNVHEGFKVYGVYDAGTGKWYQGSNEFGDIPKLYKMKNHASSALSFYLKEPNSVKEGSKDKDSFSIYHFVVRVGDKED